jgi:hypothetical protein
VGSHGSARGGSWPPVHMSMAGWRLRPRWRPQTVAQELREATRLEEDGVAVLIEVVARSEKL